VKRLLPCGALAAMLTLSGMGRADDTAKAMAQGRALIDAGRARDAIALLKEAAKRWPDDEAVHTELAAAYVADSNDFWALNVLQSFEAKHPPACAARGWIAQIQVRQASLERAEETLDRDGCRVHAQDRAREHLLRARIAHLRDKEAEARSHAQEARKQSALYEEDESLVQSMDRQFFPGRLPWGSWRLDAGLGWTSNGLAGSPVDRANRFGNEGSAVFSLDARFRAVWPETGAVRPAGEVSFRTVQLAGETARDLSYIAPGIRPGLLLGGDHPRLLLAYSFDAVRLAAEDRYAHAPVWFAEGHRVEYEIEATESLFAFGGAGRRLFREQGRSRWELDQGVAGSIALGRRARLLTGASARWNRAENEAYDSWGGTVIAQLQAVLPGKLEGRLNGSVAHEAFPRSRGYFAGALGEERIDNLVRIKPGLWSPAYLGVRAGLDYELSRRASTADAYSYTDHRVVLHLAWAMDTDRIGVRTVGKEGRTPLDHGKSATSGISSDVRIRDLMRQDEAVKQGSSCLK
jgi:hypothetical protein